MRRYSVSMELYFNLRGSYHTPINLFLYLFVIYTCFRFYNRKIKKEMNKITEQKEIK